MKKLVAAAILPVLMTGCASIIKGNSDEVTINSLEQGTTLYVNGAARGKDSAFVTLDKGKKHTITAKKDGCSPVTAQTGESFDPTTLLGIFIDWGIFTIPTDLISGAAWKIQPTSYTVTPICDDEGLAEAPLIFRSNG
jgi:uncharacterized protein YceK